MIRVSESTSMLAVTCFTVPEHALCKDPLSPCAPGFKTRSTASATAPVASSTLHIVRSDCLFDECMMAYTLGPTIAKRAGGTYMP